MSQEQTEWKTIRVDGSTYTKLNELSGLWTFIFGKQVSLNTVLQWGLLDHYNKWTPLLREVIADSERLEEYRMKLDKEGWNIKTLGNMTEIV